MDIKEVQCFNLRQLVPGQWVDRTMGPWKLAGETLRRYFPKFVVLFVCALLQVWRGHFYFRDKQRCQVEKSRPGSHLGNHLLQPSCSHCAGHRGGIRYSFSLKFWKSITLCFQYTGYRREDVKPNTS